MVSGSGGARAGAESRHPRDNDAVPNESTVNVLTDAITLEAVEWAASVIGLPPTPAWSYPVLDAVAGVTVVVKHENVQPTGAFKVRGGLTLLATLSQQERAGGLVTASTGNHAQSVATPPDGAGFGR